MSSAGSDRNDCLLPSSPCGTMQSAVDRAANYDVINVMAVSYLCEGSVPGAPSVGVNVNKTVQFRASDGPVDIDCQCNGRAFWFEDVSASLTGFTIRNGNSSSDATVFVHLSKASSNLSHTFTDCIFRNNSGA